jgi:hypothetical protein
MSPIWLHQELRQLISSTEITLLTHTQAQSLQQLGIRKGSTGFQELQFQAQSEMLRTGLNSQEISMPPDSLLLTPVHCSLNTIHLTIPMLATTMLLLHPTQLSLLTTLPLLVRKPELAISSRPSLKLL